MRLTNETEEQLEAAPAFQTERRKTFRELQGRERLTYIWDYYKWLILGISIFILVAATSIPGIIENHKEAVLYTAFVNSRLPSQESTTIMDDFVKEADIDMDGRRIMLDTSFIINRNEGDTVSMQCNQKLMALFSTNTLDVMVCDDDNFQFYAENGCFQDLQKVLPQDIFEKYEPYMLTCDTDKSESPAYYGISVKTSKVLDDEKAYAQKTEPIFTICTKASQPENAVKFLEFLMAEEIEANGGNVSK